MLWWQSPTLGMQIVWAFAIWMGAALVCVIIQLL